jgi:hypothetical protein
MERIDSSHSTWIFDTERMRFRRVPKGTDPGALSLDRDWQAYYALEIDPETGAFTVALNEDRTRLLRAFRDDAPALSEAEPTKELRLEPSAESGGG